MAHTSPWLASVGLLTYADFLPSTAGAGAAALAARNAAFLVRLRSFCLRRRLNLALSPMFPDMMATAFWVAHLRAWFACIVGCNHLISRYDSPPWNHRHVRKMFAQVRARLREAARLP